MRMRLETCHTLARLATLLLSRGASRGWGLSQRSQLASSAPARSSAAARLSCWLCKPAQAPWSPSACMPTSIRLESQSKRPAGKADSAARAPPTESVLRGKRHHERGNRGAPCPVPRQQSEARGPEQQLQRLHLPAQKYTLSSAHVWVAGLHCKSFSEQTSK